MEMNKIIQGDCIEELKDTIEMDKKEFSIAMISMFNSTWKRGTGWWNNKEKVMVGFLLGMVFQILIQAGVI